MKTLTTLIFAATAAFAVNANADAVHGDPDIGDVFPIQETSLQPHSINTIADTSEPVWYLNTVTDNGKNAWSVEYEEYVNPANLNQISQNSVASMLQELDSNPPAAGAYSDDVFKWDETAGEYQLQ